jgi:hypothetical protein
VFGSVYVLSTTYHRFFRGHVKVILGYRLFLAMGVFGRFRGRFCRERSAGGRFRGMFPRRLLPRSVRGRAFPRDASAVFFAAGLSRLGWL